MTGLTLNAFLLARFDEAERSHMPGRKMLDDLRFDLRRGDEWDQFNSSRVEDGLDVQHGEWELQVRAAVAAGRAVLGEHQLFKAEFGDWLECNVCGHASNDLMSGCRTVLFLAQPWSGHADFNPAWKL